ncbi:MAG TPA: hypothetical protein VLF66_20670 [Thermoanaerobaculia bacterium]|nr:hypothetical protein [Thermoanaerobaculia bacterium]
MKAKLFLFLLGALFGFLVAVLFRPLIQPAVTELLRDEAERTEGRVVGKRLQGKRLLLTVNAAEGTILATFGKRVEEIDMLVEEGDLVTLGVPRYEPFVEDPPVLAVRKREPPALTPEPSEAAEPRAGPGEPRRPEGGIVPGRAEPPRIESSAEPPAAEPAEEEPPAEEGDGEAEAEPPPPAA